MTWDIEDKHVLITGGNSGIGKATAEELARRGARVMITARDPARGAVAAADIEAATGDEVEVGVLDLSRLESVREFAQQYVADRARLDVLINNAGVMTGKRLATEDGFEWTLAVNYLGPFLLTNLLTSLLMSSAPSRIINVGSENYRTVKQGLNLEDLQMTEGFSPSRAYAASKMANILFTVELERRLGASGVTADVLHPGVVATSFGRSEESSKRMGWMMSGLKPFLRKPAQGARTSVFLATADRETLETGLYWSDEKPKDPIPPAVDPDVAQRLWSESARLVGLSD